MKTYVSGNSSLKVVQKSSEPEEIPFIGDVPSFHKNRMKGGGWHIHSGTGLQCSQCGLKINHGQVAFCTLHHRVVAMSENCDKNTRTSYKRLNW